MQHRDKTILHKVLAEISVGCDMLGETNLAGLIADEKLKRALSMTVINIGELIKNITDSTRKEYPHIPWKAIAGMRDIAAHKYQTLRMEDVYNTVRMDFPILKEQLEKLIKDDEEGRDG